MSTTLAPRARRDIRAISDYIAAENPAAAQALLSIFMAAFRLLDAYPEAGIDREELRLRLRSYAVGSYVIYYRPRRGGVEIARVVHGKQDHRKTFPPRKP